MSPGIDRPLLLVHGGLAEAMDATRFWVRPGVVDALRALGHVVLAPDRSTVPRSWVHAASALAALTAALSHRPVTVVAGSNGVSVGLRLALDHPGLVARLVLAWPATAGDDQVDVTIPPEAHHLLAGETIRGVTDDELRSIAVPVAVVPALVDHPIHQHATVTRLTELLPAATVIEPGFPESPRPDFASHLDAFVAAILPHL